MSRPFDNESRLIWVLPNLSTSTTILWERDRRHPGGEINLIGGGTPRGPVQVYPTDKVKERLELGTLIQVPAPTETPPKDLTEAAIVDAVLRRGRNFAFRDFFWDEQQKGWAVDESRSERDQRYAYQWPPGVPFVPPIDRRPSERASWPTWRERMSQLGIQARRLGIPVFSFKIVDDAGREVNPDEPVDGERWLEELRRVRAATWDISLERRDPVVDRLVREVIEPILIAAEGDALSLRDSMLARNRALTVEQVIDPIYRAPSAPRALQPPRETKPPPPWARRRGRSVSEVVDGEPGNARGVEDEADCRIQQRRHRKAD